MIFPYPISDLIKNLIPYFRPEGLAPGAWLEHVTSCYGTNTVVGVNIKGEMVLSPNDEEVTNSSKKQPNSKLECTNHTLFQTKMVEIDTLFQTKTVKKHTVWRGTYLFSLYKGLPLPPGRKTRCRLWVSLLTQARLIRRFLTIKMPILRSEIIEKKYLVNTSLVELSFAKWNSNFLCRLWLCSVWTRGEKRVKGSKSYKIYKSKQWKHFKGFISQFPGFCYSYIWQI